MSRRRHAWRGRAGFSIVESVMATVVVATMFVAAMRAVGASRTALFLVAERARGMALADALMSEILAQPYGDPSYGSSLGPGSDELDGTRSAWDDVDDYNGWVGNPVQDKQGAAIDGFDGWTRSVTVAWVNPSNLEQTKNQETGVKRITVTVKHGDAVRAELTTIRTLAWVEEIPAPYSD